MEQWLCLAEVFLLKSWYMRMKVSHKKIHSINLCDCYRWAKYELPVTERGTCLLLFTITEMLPVEGRESPAK